MSEPFRHEGSGSLPLARFRYQETADAAANAPAPIRMFLENVGFDFQANPSRVPDGFYDEKLDKARLELIDRMTETLSNRALRKAIERKNDQCNFDHRAFMTSVVTAKPIKLDENGNVFRIIPKRPSLTPRRRRPRPV
ncbi:hypothetical protein [Loktanella sp. Alg231-35]|uniref:hypothetical protein n=1 Tax=Loktanella sp. Alg231-35 TaxID=1922220 RepID=UPI000D54B41A|nr:hypothetical protein [Loktanella sp. Alg231-35]